MCVKADGRALSGVSDELKNDRQVVSAAVNARGDALLYASEARDSESDSNSNSNSNSNSDSTSNHMRGCAAARRSCSRQWSSGA